jgi:hypothetical protein
MNIRCYRCGNSFSLSRDAVEVAVATSGDQKAYVVHCPRCRTANKVPMQQLKRSLPAGWTPPAPAEAPAVEPTPVAAPAPEPEPEPVAETPAAKPARKRATQKATDEATPTASPAAKKASRSKSKPA